MNNRNDQAETLKNLFLVLSRMQKQNWGSEHPATKISRQAKETYELLKTSLQPISQEDFNIIFPRDRSEIIDFQSIGKVLYLPPLNKNPTFVPILTFRYSWNENISMSLKLQIMFVSYLESEKKMVGMGFRLESPHGDEEWDDEKQSPEEREQEGENVGRHDFYHAQIIQKFGHRLKVECPEWIPQTQPSFPLAAHCPSTLMLCLLLSLYGKKYCGSFVVGHNVYKIKNYYGEIKTWYGWRDEQQAN